MCKSSQPLQTANHNHTCPLSKSWPHWPCCTDHRYKYRPMLHPMSTQVKIWWFHHLQQCPGWPLQQTFPHQLTSRISKLLCLSERSQKWAASLPEDNMFPLYCYPPFAPWQHPWFNILHNLAKLLSIYNINPFHLPVYQWPLWQGCCTYKQWTLGCNPLCAPSEDNLWPSCKCHYQQDEPNAVSWLTILFREVVAQGKMCKQKYKILKSWKF